jgi:hypothetical protein
MVILRTTSILGKQKEDKMMICSITLNLEYNIFFLTGLHKRGDGEFELVISTS